MLQVSQQEFVAWLAEHADDGIVGVAGRADYCPVATYLKRQNPNSYVGATFVIIGVNCFDLPTWVTRFTQWVDKLGDGTPIYAATARRVMERVSE